MKWLRILILIALLALGAVNFTPTNAYADDPCSVTGYSDPLLCGTPNSDEEKAVITKIRNILSVVYLWVGIIAVIFIVVGGVLFMTSQGDSAKIQRGKTTILYSVCGLIITLSAFAITSLTIGALEGRTNGSVAKEGEPSDPFNSPDRNKVRAISTIDHTNVIAGGSIRIKAKAVPDYATNKQLTYKSSNSSIATIDNDGNIKAKREGEVTITISSADGVKKEVKVTVLKPIPVTSIRVSKTEVTLKKGKSTTVKATPYPLNASDRTVTWASEDPKIATVDQTGTIKAIESGKTTYVTVTAQNKQVFALNESPNKITLAATKAASTPKEVKTRIKVTVESEYYACQGPTSGKKFSGYLDLRPVTKQFVTPHTKDFKWDTFDGYIKSKGGYTSYVKSLGGIFTIFAGKDKRIKTVSACDFQAAAEYTYGLMTIWGPDYDNGTTYHKWGDETPDQSDAYHNGEGGRYARGHYSEHIVDENLSSSSKPVRVNCNASCDTLLSKTTLWHEEHMCTHFISGVRFSKVGKITDVSKLQVGDVLHFFDGGGGWHHVAVVGEVYSDYIVTYDGGGRFISNKKFKWKIPRHGSMIKNTTYSNYDIWYGVRYWNIDQNRTLEGLH